MWVKKESEKEKEGAREAREWDEKGINEQARDMENERLRLVWYNLNPGPFMTSAQSTS